MAGTLPIPSIGSPNTQADPKIKEALETLNNKFDAENKVPGTSISTAAAIADTQLASPNNSAYRALFQAQSVVAAELAAGTYILGTGMTTVAPRASGTDLRSGGSAQVPPLFNFLPEKYEVSSKTLKLTLLGTIAVNATIPTGVKFQFGLYPVTVAGGANELKVTLGAVVSGSIVEVTSPPASSVTRLGPTDFTAPAFGAYALGVVTSAALTTNSVASLSSTLLYRSV